MLWTLQTGRCLALIGRTTGTGISATAHVILTGRSAAKEHRYKDTITLRCSDEGVSSYLAGADRSPISRILSYAIFVVFI